jgi:hypothetical protein
VSIFVPLGGDLAGNLVAGLIGNNIVDAFAVADANSQTGKLLRHLIGPAFDEFKSLADMNAVVASATAMNAVVASATVMNAVAASATARNAIRNSSTAFNIVAGSSMAIGKFVAGEAGLNPADYADMNAVAASATAMNAVAASATAMNAVVASATAMDAVAASATAMNAVAASATAMNAVAASATAMNAVAASATAMDAVAASATAMNAICKSAIAAQAVYAPIQSRRSTLLTTLADGSKFSKTTVNVGNGAGTFDHGLNTNTIYIPTACYDDGDTDHTVYYGADTSKSVVSIARHGGAVSVTSGVSLRGVRVVGSGSSVGYVTFDVYTAL